MEHSIPNDSATIAACIPFFENPTTSDYDLEIYAFDMEDPYCDTTIQAAVIVRSLGSNTVNSIEINYQINDQQASYTWTGNMEPYQHKIISFPITAVAKGENTLKVNVGQINTSYQDTLVEIIIVSLFLM